MVVRLLERHSSCRGALDYNIKKVFDCKAQLCYVQNIEPAAPGGPTLCTSAVKHTMLEYESNPRISAKVKRKGFHMAFNPGPEDNISEVDCLLCIADLMKMIGYGQQPYAVFQHYDIDREHYHIVSVNVRKDGSVINSSFNAYDVMEAARFLGSQYGFEVGLTEEQKRQRKKTLLRAAEELPEVSSLGWRFNPKGNVLEGLQEALYRALSYDFKSFYEFVCVTNSLGVHCERYEMKDGGYHLLLKGLDGEGNKVTLFFSAENDLKLNGYGKVLQAIGVNSASQRVRGYADVRAEVVAEWCKKASSSADEFTKMMRDCGLEVFFVREKDMSIARIAITDPREKCVFRCETLSGELSAESFRREESSGRWRKPRKRGHEKGKVSVSREEKLEIRDRIRERCQREGIAIPQRTKAPAVSVKRR